MDKLALYGGAPVRKAFLPYARHWLGDEEITEVVDTLRSDWITSGPKIERFEKEMSAYLGCDHVVAVSSCTAALHLSLLSSGIRAGDEIIIPDLTFAATPSVSSMVGATPVLADIRTDTFDIDPDMIKKKITPRTKAIMPVHYAGQPCDMDEILEIANENGLKVIEDAAHAIGAEYKGRKIGTIGDAACFSFHPIKNMTMGEGGIIATDDAELAEKARLLRLHGLKNYKMIELGYKYTINELQAALGLAQLKRLDGFNNRRREIARRYEKELGGITIAPKEKGYVRHVWHLYVIKLRLEKLSIGRDRFRECLRAENIGTQVHFIPVHEHPYYRNLGYTNMYPNTTNVYNSMLTLPLFPKMSDDDVSDVIEAVKKVAMNYEKN